ELNIKFTLMFYSERSQGSPQAVRLCRLQNRSLLSVNEDFEGKRNTEIYFLVTPNRSNKAV
ncbi:MAG: hypothetical protein IJB01_04295, partial [Bacteroidaceae bacterium]|nr:hypothetical protein [Bacteroidaceae bacterium]